MITADFIFIYPNESYQLDLTPFNIASARHRFRQLSQGGCMKTEVATGAFVIEDPVRPRCAVHSHL